MESGAPAQPCAYGTDSENPPLRDRFNFTQVWFEETARDNDWSARLAPLMKRSKSYMKEEVGIRILEIGVYEGASTTWFLDNLCDHPKSRMVAVDTFAGGMEHVEELTALKTRTAPYVLNEELETRFRDNVAKCGNAEKLRMMRMDSESALLSLRREHEAEIFDLVYIDGSHVAWDVLRDAVLVWPMLKIGGLLLFDDYTWKGYNEDCFNPRIAIKAFVECTAPQLKCENTASQMWVTKVPKHIKATENPDPALFYW